MGKVNVTYIPLNPRSIRGIPAVPIDPNYKGENLTSSSTVARTTQVADRACIWRVATDTNVMVLSAASDSDDPTSSSGTMLWAGQTDYFAGENGHKLRVINA